MKATIRKFVSNRYKANATCPCGKDNKNGRFATEKGYEGQPVGHCHDCIKDFWLDDSTLVDLSRVDRQTTEVNYCTFGWKDIESTFDFYLESGFAKFLVKTLGEERATAIAKKYLLGIWKVMSFSGKLIRISGLDMAKLLNITVTERGKNKILTGSSRI